MNVDKTLTIIRDKRRVYSRVFRNDVVLFDVLFCKWTYVEPQKLRDEMRLSNGRDATTRDDVKRTRVRAEKQTTAFQTKIVTTGERAVAERARKVGTGRKPEVAEGLQKKGGEVESKRKRTRRERLDEPKQNTAENWRSVELRDTHTVDSIITIARAIEIITAVSVASCRCRLTHSQSVCVVCDKEQSYGYNGLKYVRQRHNTQAAGRLQTKIIE